MNRMRQPLERIARAPAEQRVGDLLGRRELRRRDAFQLAEDPAMMRALALAVRVGKAELEAVLPRPGPAAEDFRDRKQVEHALLRLCGELLEPLRWRLRRAQGRRKGEDRDQRPDCSFRHRSPQHDGVQGVRRHAGRL